VIGLLGTWEDFRSLNKRLYKSVTLAINRFPASPYCSYHRNIAMNVIGLARAETCLDPGKDVLDLGISKIRKRTFGEGLSRRKRHATPTMFSERGEGTLPTAVPAGSIPTCSNSFGWHM
jgi:hypothetical protein